MIRRMTPVDLPAVTRLDARVFGQEAWTLAEFGQELAGPDRLYFVWEGVDPALGQRGEFDTPGQRSRFDMTGRSSGLDGGPGTSRAPAVVLGYAGVWTGGPDAHLLTLAVSPSVRRSGIGTGLVSAAARAARLADCRRMRLEVRVDNLAAIRLYEHLGFVRIGYEPHYYQPEDVDAYIMGHTLGSVDHDHDDRHGGRNEHGGDDGYAGKAR